jgi:hypothetical protein
VAAGERIVAFAQAGKSPEIAFLTANRASVLPFADILNIHAWQRFLKPGAIEIGVQEQLEMAAASKKRERRKSLHQPGWIILEGGFAVRPCVVQDLSARGAKITIDDPNPLPAKLRLAFRRDARTGRNCEVVWRRGKSAGIKFVR